MKRKKVLSEKYNIAMTAELESEVQAMCNLSTAIADEARAEGRIEGRNEGRIEGRKEGRKEGILEALFELVKDGILTITDAARRAGMDIHDFEKAYKTFIL